MAQGIDFKSGFIRSIAGLGLVVAAATAAPASADVKRGVDAWSAGDYATAVAQWQLPASNGDADALFNLAQAYRLGRGVPADVNRARELYAEAAQKGHVKAADNYGLLLFQQGQQAARCPLSKMLQNAVTRARNMFLDFPTLTQTMRKRLGARICPADTRERRRPSASSQCA